MLKKIIYLLLLLVSLLGAFGEKPAIVNDDEIEAVWLHKKEGMNFYVELIQYKNGLFRLKDNKGIVNRQASWKYNQHPDIIFITADVAPDVAYWQKIYFNEDTQAYLKANKAYFNLEEKTVGIKIQKDQQGRQFIIFMKTVFYRVEGD